MIRRFFKEEGAKLKKMNFTDKRQYIWEYYKLHIFLLALGAIILGSLINTWFINPPKRDYLYIAWQAGIVMQDNLDILGQRLNVMVENQERYHVSVRSYYLTGEPQLDQALITRFHAMVHVGDLHATIMPWEDVLPSAAFGVIKPVDDLLTAAREINLDLYHLLWERVVMLNYVPDGQEDFIEEAMAISLQGAPLLEELGYITDDLYIAMIVTSDNYYELAKALAVMFLKGDYHE